MAKHISRTVLSRRQFTAALGASATLAALTIPSRAEAVTVNFLGWQGYDDPVTFDAGWLKAKNLTVNASYIGNNDEIVAKMRGGGLGQIDIVTPYMGYVPLLAKLGLIQPIDVSRVPNLKDVLPIFRNDPNINVDGQLYAVPFTWGSGAMIYDPAVIPTPPPSWRDLLKPEYAGKVGMMDDPLGNIMIASLVATPEAQSPTKLTAEQLAKSVDFLIEVKKQSRTVAASWGDLADALSRGDVAVTFNGWETITKFCADKGKAVKYTYPKERTNAWLDNYCIAKDAPHLDAAYELCDRVISVDGQRRLADVAIQAIVNKDAVTALSPAIRALYPYDEIDSFGETAGFFGFPPIEPENGLTTFPDWLREYERFKAA